MADKLKSNDEPSIEEILDSIRQIISEDETAKDDPDDQDAVDEMFGEDTAEDAALEDFDDSPEDEDVFDLTERVDEPVAAPPPPPPPPPPPVEVPVAKVEKPAFEVDLIDETIKTEPVRVVETSIPEPIIKPTPEPKMPSNDPPAGDSILSDAAEKAAFSAIADLARRTAVEHNGGVTLEDIVRSELKPLLHGWLDRNLPTLIQRLVAEELERVSKRVLEE